MTTVDQALPQLTNELQRRLVHHLATRPGFSTTDRLMSELFPVNVRGIDRMRYDATKRQLSSALRRLQHIGFVRYDDTYGGWWR